MTAIDRHLRPRVLEALQDTRVVVVLGARQVGKSTLVQSIAADEWPASVLTLDDLVTRDIGSVEPNQEAQRARNAPEARGRRSGSTAASACL